MADISTPFDDDTVFVSVSQPCAEKRINACILADGNLSFVMRSGDTHIALVLSPEQAGPIGNLITRATFATPKTVSQTASCS